MNTQVDLLIERLWEKERKKDKLNDVNKSKFVEKLYGKFAEIPPKAITLLNPWLQIFEELIFWLDLHQEFLSNLRGANRKHDASLRPTWLLAAKATREAVAIRILVITGHTEVARILLRTLLETLDVELALLDDPELAIEYEASFLSNSESKETEFWFKHFSKGKLSKRIANLVERTCKENELVGHSQKAKSVLKEFMSRSVHSSTLAAFQSSATPSFEAPGMIDLSRTGKISAYTPSFLEDTNYQIYGFTELFFFQIVHTERLLKRAKFNRKNFRLFKSLSCRQSVYHDVFSFYGKHSARLNRKLKYL
jgi:hypothetical protein